MTKTVPLPRGTVITVSEAAELAGVSDDTVRRWATEDGLGVQPGGRNRRYRISYPALMAFLSGDQAALEAMKLGRFDHPIVRPRPEGTWLRPASW